MTNNETIKKIVEISAPTYKNSTPFINLAGTELNGWDVVKATLQARLNLGLLGEAGMGKSQLLADAQSIFGNNTSYVLGRNDLDIKTLFRQMNMTPLTEAMNKGGKVAQKDLTEITNEIYKPLTIVEEINRCAEQVQNQFFNIFEGFIELDGKKYYLGGTELKKFKDMNGNDLFENVRYSVGMWSANFGNGQYSGTVSMDKALKERSHIIIDIDNFIPQSKDLDDILLGNSGEVRLKEQDNPEDRTKLITSGFEYLKQKSLTPNIEEMGEELLLFRYLISGLDYIPSESAGNSKRIMKGVWPAKAEEDDIGSDNDKYIYRMTFPASTRGAMIIMSFARSLREYVKAKNYKAKPTVLDSVIESFKIVSAYSGMIRNTQRIREEFADNSYQAAVKIGNVLSSKLNAKRDLIDAIIYKKKQGKPYTQKMLNECKGEYECFR